MNEIHPELASGLKWGSHLPSLAACLAASDGPVLEVGVGHFSTPFLHAYCAAARRDLTSVEADAGWGVDFRSRYETPDHGFFLEPYEKIFPEILNRTSRNFGVIFLDHSPGIQRVADFKLLSTCAQYLVVHDFADEIEEGITPLLVRPFRYKVISEYLPRTLIVATTWPLPDVTL